MVLLTFVFVDLWCVGGSGDIGVHAVHFDLGGGSWWRLEGGIVRFDSGER